LTPFCWLIPNVVEDPFYNDILKGVWEWLSGDSFDAQPYSVIGGIITLCKDGDIWIAMVLFLFSVVFPICKLGASCWLIRCHDETPLRYLNLLKTLGPWSMLDVFVVAITVLAFKSFPGGTRVTVGVGYHLFLCSVLLGMCGAIALTKRTNIIFLTKTELKRRKREAIKAAIAPLRVRIKAQRQEICDLNRRIGTERGASGTPATLSSDKVFPEQNGQS
jgi:hypothetical protein